MNSMAAARFNGYIAGNGSLESLQQDLGSFGLSEQGEKLLLEIGKNRLIWSQGSYCPVD
jgi:hypothetical protein